MAINKLSNDELLAYYEKLATLTLTINHLLNTIPDDAFKMAMKKSFKNTLDYTDNFCRYIRREIYDTKTNKQTEKDLLMKSEFVIKQIDNILNIASTVNPIAYAAFTNELVLSTNKIIYHYCKDDPNAIMVDTKPIQITQ